MLLSQKYYRIVEYLTLFCVLVFHTTYTYSGSKIENESEVNEIPASPGQGFYPILITDNENSGGVLSFVGRKRYGGHYYCYSFPIELTSLAIKDGVSMAISHHKRLPTNHKWSEKSENLLFEITESTPVQIFYNDAGHRGVHGGPAHRDTHHNWGIRLVKNDKYLPADISQWEKYAGISDPEKIPIKVFQNECGTHGLHHGIGGITVVLKK